MNIKTLIQNVKFKSKQVYRLLNFKKREEIVWNDLIALHTSKNFKFGQYDADKYITVTFTDENSNPLHLYHYVFPDVVALRVNVLTQFNIERTNDILVLASHFNNKLNFGMVKVDLELNCVELFHKEKNLNYLLFPDLLEADISDHYFIALDCMWAFNQLIESGDDPVFIFSELLNKKERKNENE
jgi:hypothetical protein